MADRHQTKQAEWAAGRGKGEEEGKREKILLTSCHQASQWVIQRTSVGMIMSQQARNAAAMAAAGGSALIVSD